MQSWWDFYKYIYIKLTISKEHKCVHEGFDLISFTNSHMGYFNGYACTVKKKSVVFTKIILAAVVARIIL